MENLGPLKCQNQLGGSDTNIPPPNTFWVMLMHVFTKLSLSNIEQVNNSGSRMACPGGSVTGNAERVAEGEVRDLKFRETRVTRQWLTKAGQKQWHG